MSPEDSLPVVLISAADANSAASVISQLAESPSDLEVSGADDNSRVWKLVNKYYTARVRLQPQLDNEQTELGHIEAHIIYLTEAECASEEGPSLVERRAAAAPGGGEVLLAACECGGEGEGGEQLWEAARRLRYEYVPLREIAPSQPDDCSDEENQPFPELYGVSRARAALHAHSWPGRGAGQAASRGAGQAAGRGADSEPDSDSEAEAVSRAEMFAEALQMLGTSRELSAESRRDHAEVLVDAFCRALGML